MDLSWDHFKNSLQAKTHCCALALLQSQPDKEVCPPMVCKLGSRRKRVTWIMCDECEQWFHVGCLGLTAKTADALDTWQCSICM